LREESLGSKQEAERRAAQAEAEAAALRAQFEASQRHNASALAAVEGALRAESEQRAALERQLAVAQGMLQAAVRERDLLKQVGGLDSYFISYQHVSPKLCNFATYANVARLARGGAR
jgi:hypothetical protein